MSGQCHQGQLRDSFDTAGSFENVGCAACLKEPAACSGLWLQALQTQSPWAQPLTHPDGTYLFSSPDVTDVGQRSTDPQAVGNWRQWAHSPEHTPITKIQRRTKQYIFCQSDTPEKQVSF